MINLDLKSPCGNCPFRSDVKFHLSRARAMEFAQSDEIFLCHKTLDYETEGGDGRGADTELTQACAGYLIMRTKEHNPGKAMIMLRLLGLFDAGELNIGAPVYASQSEFVEAVSGGHP